jgi:hypothetical protein
MKLLKQAWKIGRGLTVLTLVNLFVIVFSTIARIIDDTAINGISVWDKPIKFAISFIAFAPMVIWLFSRIERTKLIRMGIGILGWSMVVEISVIFLQSIRGTTSHFNNATMFDGTLYNIMAGGVGIFAVAGMVTGFVLARKNLGEGPMATATKFAIPMMTIGGTLGFAMTGPKPGQIAAGGNTIGAHSVGGVDSSVGIPFLGWSTEYGDLRVAHFLGLHSLHVVPLVALLVVWLVNRETLRLTNQQQQRVTALSALAWGGLVATTLLQALRGVAITQSDSTTLVSLIAFAGIPAVWAVAMATYRGNSNR